MAAINDSLVKDYAHKHYAELRKKEAQMGDGKRMSEIDIAKAMLEDGTIKQEDFDKYKQAVETSGAFANTAEYAYLDQVEQEILMIPGWQVEKNNADKNPYLVKQEVSAEQKRAFMHFKNCLEEAHKAFDAQIDYDGFFEDMADVFGRMGRNKNYAAAVRKDLETADKNLKELEDAMKLGYDEFCTAFKKTFGRDYNYQAIKNLNTVENLYLAAFPAKYQEESFNNKFKELLSDKGLQERTKTVNDPQLQSTTTVIIASKEQVYQENFNNLAQVFQEQINSNNTKSTIEQLKHYRKWLVLEENRPKFETELTSKYTKSDVSEQIAKIDDAIRMLEAANGKTLEETKALKECLQGMLTMSKEAEYYTFLKEQIDTLEAQIEILECGSGKEYLNKMIKAAGKENGTLNEKFAVLSGLAKGISKRMHDQTVEAGGGQEFDRLQRTYDNAYKQAYGNNDILKRVKEYNASQVEGGQLAKQVTAFVVLTGIAVSSLGTATPLAAGAATTASTTAATAAALGKGAVIMAGYTLGSNAFEELTRGTNTKILKEKGVEAYIKSVGKNTQWGNVAVETLASGVTAVVIGGIVCKVSNLCVVAGMSKLATSSSVGGTMFAVGEGQEVLMTGKITWKGAAFNVLIAFSAGALHFLNMTKVENAIQAEQTKVQLENEVQNAREILGISDRTELTEDLLKSLRKEIAQLHSDKTGGASDIEFSVRWAAYEKLLEGFNKGITQAILRTYSQKVNAKPLGLPEKTATAEQPVTKVQPQEALPASTPKTPVPNTVSVKPAAPAEAPESTPVPTASKTNVTADTSGETPLVVNSSAKKQYVAPKKTEIDNFGLDDRFADAADKNASKQVPGIVEIMPAEQKRLVVEEFFTSNNLNEVLSIYNIDFSQYGKDGIPLKYSRENFINDLDALLSTLSHAEREKVESKFGIKIQKTEFGKLGKEIVGIPQIPETIEDNQIEQSIVRLIKKFTVENEVQIADKNIKELLESILHTIPEFAMTVGKKQHGSHAYSLDIHTLKVLQYNIANPKFAELDAESQLVLKYASILHDIGKRFFGDIYNDGGHSELSAEYAKKILERFDLSSDIKLRIINQIKNHHWFEIYNDGGQSPELIAKIAAIFKTKEEFTIAEIFAESDFKNVSETFHLSRKRSRIVGDGLMSEEELRLFLLTSFQKIEKIFDNSIPTKSNENIYNLNALERRLYTEGLSRKDVLKLKKQLQILTINETIERKYFKITKINENNFLFEFFGKSREVNNKVKKSYERNYKILSPEDMIEFIKFNSKNSDLAETVENLYMVGLIREDGLKVIYDSVQHNANMSQEEIETVKNALFYYKTKTYYKAINRLLRGLTIDDLCKSGMYKKEFKKLINDTVDALKYFISLPSNVYDHELILFRRDTYDILDDIKISIGEYKNESLSKILKEFSRLGNINIDELNNKLTGTNIVQKSFLSTSLNKDAADSCDRIERPIMWKFKTKGNIQGIYIDAYNKNWSTEMEFLMQINTNITINHIEFIDDHWEIDATVNQ